MSIARLLYPSENVFEEYDSTLKESHWIYDTGIVDANGDGLLDILTTNHNWRQRLLLADGQVVIRMCFPNGALIKAASSPALRSLRCSRYSINRACIYTGITGIFIFALIS